MNDSGKFTDIVYDLPQKQLDALLKAMEEISTEESDLEPTQVREIVPVRPWLRSRYHNSFAKNLYPYWEDEIADFIEGGYNEWIVTGSIGTGKSSAALVAVQRKIYEMSCFNIPQRLFRLADMTKIFFAYLSVNLKQADFTGFGQIRGMIDSTPYFADLYPRDSNIDSVLKFPGGIFLIPGSDTISVIGTNLFGTILDEANFLRKSGMSDIGDVSKAQEIYAETTDRRRSRFMFQGKDPGFSILVSSSTVQTSFTSARIEKADAKTKVTCTRLWEVKPKAYSDRSFFVFNGTEKDDPFVIQDIRDLDDLIEDPEDRDRARERSYACALEGESQIEFMVDLLPEYLSGSITAVPVDFRASFDTDIYKALRNIAGVSISPVGKLFASRMLWNAAIDPALEHPFTKDRVTLGLQETSELSHFFKFEKFFEGPVEPWTDAGGNVHEGSKRNRPRRHPYSPRYIHVDLSITTDWAGIVCVHQAGRACPTPGSGVSVPVVETDFILSIEAPKPPDRTALHKVRAFIFLLKRLGMKIGRVTFDQFQSEDSIQLLTVGGIEAGRCSVDKDDKAYLDTVQVLNEGRIRMYEYPRLRTEFFNLDHDRGKRKVDHPEKNPDGSTGSKDVADAFAAAISNCIADDQGSYIERKDALKKVRVSGPRFVKDCPEDFRWVVPKEYQDRVEVDAKPVGGDPWESSRRSGK